MTARIARHTQFTTASRNGRESFTAAPCARDMPLILPGNAHLVDRRAFLTGVTTVSATAALAVAPATRADASPGHGRGHSRDTPFTLGVASGDPTPWGVVLWTRLAPEPFEPNGGMPPGHAVVQWRVATDEQMRHVVRHGTAHAPADMAHSVHVEVEGLRPGTPYFYDFRYRNHRSPVARTKTLPATHANVSQLDFAFVSCQAWSDGFFPSYRHMAAEYLDFVLHLGDYVYEYEIPADGGLRSTPVPPLAQPAPQTLEQWRARYALYKSDPDLQAAHARFPFIVTWDDHEVSNDYAGGGEGQTAAFTAVRAAAYQAYYEHQPLRLRSLPRGVSMQLYRRLRFGNLAQLDVLDGRQYRDAPPCGWGEAPACDAAHEPAVRNAVFVTGDWHSTFVNDVHLDFDRPGSPVVATEFVGTSISTNGDTPQYGPYYGPMIKHNPHIRFFDGDRRGYVRCRVTPDRWRSELRMTTSVATRGAGQYTLAAFEVADGVPGARRV